MLLKLWLLLQGCVSTFQHNVEFKEFCFDDVVELSPPYFYRRFLRKDLLNPTPRQWNVLPSDSIF